MTAKVAFVRTAFVTSLLATVTLAAQNVPLSKRTGTGAISGVVIDAETKRPVAGALVYLGMAGYGPVGSRSRQITDAKGRFVYTDLPAADIYFINVNKAGYVDGHYGDRGPSPISFTNPHITLAEGQWFDQATIMLWKPGSISGTVSDERGEPVVAATVRLVRKIQVAGTPHLAAGPIVTTDDRGRYRFAGILPGDYLVNVPSVQTAVPAATSPLTIEGLTPETAARGDDQPRRNNGVLDLDPSTLLVIGNYATPPSTPAGGAPQAYPAAFYPGSSLVSAATAIALKPGESRDGIDVALRPVPTARVSGRIVVASGAPNAAGMVLRLIWPGLEDLAGGSEAATTLVAPDGRFTFLNVPAGDYLLSASRSSLEYQNRVGSDMPATPGYVPGPGTFLGGAPAAPPGTNLYGRHERGDANLWARLPLSVGAADVTDLVVPLRRGASMHGRIAWDGVGVPPGPIAVVGEPADGSTWLGMPQTAARASFDDNPQFTITGFLAGEYMLRVIGITPPYAVKSIMIGGRDFATRPIDASSGQDFDDVVVTFTDRIASIKGAVAVDANAPPVSVIAFPFERDQWSRYGMSAPRFKTIGVSNSGLYKIDNIPAGRYFVVAVDSDQSQRWSDLSFLSEASRVATEISVGWGETVSQDLKVSVIK